LKQKIRILKITWGTSQFVVTLNQISLRAIRQRKMSWAGHVAHVGEMRNAYRTLTEKYEGIILYVSILCVVMISLELYSPSTHSHFQVLILAVATCYGVSAPSSGHTL
jgi:hypothetical protein